MKMELIWTKEKPIKPGWYWLRTITHSAISIAKICEQKDVIPIVPTKGKTKGLIFMIAEMPLEWFPLDELYFNYEWAGPIPEPKKG